MVQKLIDQDEEEEEDTLALVARPRKAVEITTPSELPPVVARPCVEKALKKNSSMNPESPEVDIVSRLTPSTPGGAGSETEKIK